MIIDFSLDINYFEFYNFNVVVIGSIFINKRLTRRIIDT